MKKIITVGLLVLIGLTSLESNAQLGNLLSKKDKKTSDSKSDKEVVMEDESGTIFGNYYFKVIHGTQGDKSGSKYDSYGVEKNLKSTGQTLQLKRYEAGKDNIVRVSIKGTTSAEYSYNNNVCGACEQTNAAGFVRYRAMDYFEMDVTKESTQTAWFLKGDISSFVDGVLSIGNINDFNFRGLIIMSKDKSKLDLVTPENVSELAQKASENYKAALKNGDKGKKMPKPGNAFNAPVYAKTKTNSVNACKSYLADKGLSYLEPIYSYEMANGSEYAVINDNYGKQIARQVQFFTVCKNNKIGPDNDLNKHLFKTKYVVFVTTCREDGANGAFGKTYVTIMGNDMPITDTENIMQYK